MKLAEALNFSQNTIRAKFRLLHRMCLEAIALLADMSVVTIAAAQDLRVSPIAREGIESGSVKAIWKGPQAIHDFVEAVRIQHDYIAFLKPLQDLEGLGGIHPATRVQKTVPHTADVGKQGGAHSV
ncbi:MULTISPECIES: hypothetical protein [Stenotrophomonas]|uniref:hypothetical protein n=1 Tax=Stenotrophomonas TaxID=40323 RepID=UPI0012FDF407|nr:MULTISPECIES: hypothetical protein [Stenotrophomonas]